MGLSRALEREFNVGYILFRLWDLMKYGVSSVLCTSLKQTELETKFSTGTLGTYQYIHDVVYTSIP